MAIAARHTHTYEDFLTLVRARRRASGARTWWRYALWMAIYLAVLVWFTPDLLRASAWREGFVWAIVLGGLAAMAVIIWAVDLLFDRVVYRLHYRRLATAGAEVTLNLDEDGIAWTIRDIGGRLPWSAVTTVDDQEDGLVLFISPLEGMVVPRRAFASLGEYEAARTLIRERTHDTA